MYSWQYLTHRGDAGGHGLHNSDGPYNITNENLTQCSLTLCIYTTLPVGGTPIAVGVVGGVLILI